MARLDKICISISEGISYECREYESVDLKEHILSYVPKNYKKKKELRQCEWITKHW